MSKTIIIIPARYASTRFPGKPLAEIGGVPMIVRVARRLIPVAQTVTVATDDRRIETVCNNAGIDVVMTREDHKSGTDRVYEAYETIRSEKGEYDIVVNVQGDEPFINPEHVRTLISLFDDPEIQIATLATPFPQNGGYDGLADPNLVKVVKSSDNQALYFSRSVIPYLRGIDKKGWPSHHQFLTHIGIYAYRPHILSSITQMPQTTLEKCESLEQLRWLENGLKIKVGIVSAPGIGIDTPEDLKRAETLLSSGVID